MKQYLVAIVLITISCATARADELSPSPRILGVTDAKLFIEVCKQVPPEVSSAFEFHESLKQDDVYEQVITTPNNEVLVLVSGVGIAGLIVIDGESKRVKIAYSWSDYLREHGVAVFTLDRAYYRLEQRGTSWMLVAELHAITDRSGGYHYLWQFTYSSDGSGGYSSGSSTRYKLKE